MAGDDVELSARHRLAAVGAAHAYAGHPPLAVDVDARRQRLLDDARAEPLGGGYGGEFKQTYIGQVRSFEIVDDGNSLAIADVRQDPATPNLEEEE